jgi:glyoxylase-like metal-dependent hydrolase (beta-lactamase superfamily II)
MFKKSEIFLTAAKSPLRTPFLVLATLLATLLTCSAPAALAQDAKTVLNNASKAMGADNLKSLEFTATGWEYTFGQAYNPKSPWGGFEDKTYTRIVNFETPSWHIDRVLAPIPANRRGGGLPPAASQTIFINPNTGWAQQLDHWMLPYGFIRAALANTAIVEKQTIGGGKNLTVVTFTAPNKAKVSGYIDDQGMVERVETMIDNPVTGDTPLVAIYSDYKDFAGLKFPTKIVRKQGDWPILNLTVTDAKPNAAVNFQAPAAGAGGGGGGGAAPTTVSRPLGDGVYLILGGYASIAVDFKDYIVVLEGGNSEANASAIIAEAKRLIPNKPIKYLFNTHGHFDHSSGLRRFMAEGATIITWEGNKKYFEQIAILPHTLNPDMLAQSPKKPSIEGVTDKKVLTDGNHVIEIYRLKDSTHNEGLLMAYLPKEKVLLEADDWNPPNDADAAPGPLNNTIYNKNLMDNLKRLNLTVETIVPVHYPPNNRPVTMAEFSRAYDKLPSGN